MALHLNISKKLMQFQKFHHHFILNYLIYTNQIRKRQLLNLPLEGLPETETLFYQDDPMEFDAKVLKVIDDMVVLDRTSFYARGGGQEPDMEKLQDSKYSMSINMQTLLFIS